ncbi:dihydrofolate reductase [Corynebacterium breve]|uniref:dihydrofolate reductase n=1 Tax=Corynebacterium breve TaxID=3049799 RepID=A0ABY8VFU6_9CORY|nr:dihydrofolate reductase [Corynebacterium breve]WIM68368.1 dihydrofolate reductase [Corynebacterium breve]
MIGAIWAQTLDGVIGDGKGMPWHLSEDLRNFKATTLGSPVVMGRRTWESLPKRPLPGRDNYIVSSREPGYWSDGAFVTSDLPELHTDAWILGGPGLWEAFMGQLDVISITLIDAHLKDYAGQHTVYAPRVPEHEFALMNDSGWMASEKGRLLDSPESAETLRYRFLRYERKVAKDIV